MACFCSLAKFGPHSIDVERRLCSSPTDKGQILPASGACATGFRPFRFGEDQETSHQIFGCCEAEGLNAEREAVVERRVAEAAEIEFKAALEDKKDSKSDQQHGKELIMHSKDQTPPVAPPKPSEQTRKVSRDPFYCKVIRFIFIYHPLSHMFLS
jgi:hypothetical protein